VHSHHKNCISEKRSRIAAFHPERLSINVPHGLKKSSGQIADQGRASALARERPRWQESVRAGSRASALARERPRWQQSIHVGSRASALAEVFCHVC